MLNRPRNFADKSAHLWIELPDAAQVLDQMPASDSRTILEHFGRHGYAIAGDRVRDAEIAAFLTELDHRLEDPASATMMTYWADDGKRHEPARRVNLDKPEAKVLDVHTRLPTSLKLIFNPLLLGFLREVFHEEPVAFQTLFFEYGSQQGAHQDTAFVIVEPPFQLVASWIALEDVTADSGELFFYPGSHAIGDMRFADGGKAFDPFDAQAAIYSNYLQAIARGHGLRRQRFQPKRGEVLFWINDLIHGGEPIRVAATRRSLVTHYCPLSAAVPWARPLNRTPEPVPGGGYILSAT